MERRFNRRRGAAARGSTAPQAVRGKD